MLINQRSDPDQSSQNVPAPEGAGTEAIGNAAAHQLVADPLADIVHPDNGVNAQGKPGENEDNQQIMGGFLAVVATGDGVDVRADIGEHTQRVNAQRDDAQEDGFEQTAVCSQCRVRSAVIRLTAGVYIDVHIVVYLKCLSFLSCYDICVKMRLYVSAIITDAFIVCQYLLCRFLEYPADAGR